ncbi:DUF5333 domain-containing protein [Pseudooceanicola sp. LIPI14-2-Ac024]|uniref:DUF5333 domain-containing protein n=1 Tax=Pseudooceanicola sp. LIPI14-2-Ac024 TaxID=3344875 RepID=UPI0035CF723A
MRLASISLAALMALPAAAEARPPLRDVPEIDDKMLWVALAYEISDRCEAIAPRTLTGLGYLWDLKAQANKLGYSNDEIKEYVRSDAEKARMRVRGEAYVRARGLNPDSDADLCRLGTQEMEKGTQIGAFLKEK